MNKQQELITQLKGLFREMVEPFSKDLHGSWDKEPCRSIIDNFKDELSGIDLHLTKTYHAHSIGNNNEQNVVYRTIDNDGFVIERVVAQLHITYGVYGGVSIWIVDNTTRKEICGIHHAR